MSFSTGLIGLIESLTVKVQGNVEAYSNVETIVDGVASSHSNKLGNLIIGKDGALGTIIRFDGSRVIMGAAEVTAAADAAAIKLASRMRSNGYSLDISITRDPEGGKAITDKFVSVQSHVAKQIGLDAKSVLDEQRDYLPRWIVKEDIFFTVWTRPSALLREDKAEDLKEREEALKARREAGDFWAIFLPQAPDAQKLMPMSKKLLTRHADFVKSILNDMGDIFEFSLPDAHEAARIMYNCIYPYRRDSNWKAILPTDTATIRTGSGNEVSGWTRGDTDNPMAALLAPRFDQQIFTDDIDPVPSSPYIRIGEAYFYTADVTTPAMVQRPFQSLLASLIRHDGAGENPWRVTFKIEGTSSPKIGIRSLLASILGTTTPSSGYNQNIKASLSYISLLAKQNVAVCRVRVSLTTWSRVSDTLKKIESRSLAVVRAFEGWGDWQLSAASGMPSASTLATVPGLNTFSTAPSGYAPLNEILRLAPLSREVSPWGDSGAMGLRTEDGRWFPITLGGTSNKQTTFNYLVVGTPGKGKSFLMATLYYSSCLSPGMTDGIGGYAMPYIRGIDFGFSQQGTVAAFREWLPAKRRHEALHVTMQPTPEYRINPFDTPLGCRQPAPADRESIYGVLGTIASAEDGSIIEHMSDMITQLVEEVYDYYSDKTRSKSNPKMYDRNANVELHDVLLKHLESVGMSADDCHKWLWWQVVDQLALGFKDYHWAAVAQRYAVPTISDVIAFTSESLTRNYGSLKTSTGTGVSIIQTFQLKLSGALSKYPILGGATNVDIGQAHVAIIDVKNICSSGVTPDARKQNALMFLLCDHALSSSFYRVDKEIESDISNPDYREYHRPIIRRLSAITKIKSLDEAHMASGVEAFWLAKERDCRVGRKYNIMNIYASQKYPDFPANVRDFASGVLICGFDKKEDADFVSDSLKLTSRARRVVANDLVGPSPDGSGAGVMMWLSVADKVTHEHFVKNTIGPVMTWAFSTTAVDVALRESLYRRMSQDTARQMLAKRFPRGSATKEILQIVQERAVEAAINLEEDKEANEKLTSSVIDDVATELERLWVLSKT